MSEPLVSRHGVITLFGYGASISVDRGHLLLEDRIGPNHRTGRFAKIESVGAQSEDRMGYVRAGRTGYPHDGFVDSSKTR
jgi:hypothetical protein